MTNDSPATRSLQPRPPAPQPPSQPPAHEKPPTQPPSQAPAPKASPPVSQPPSQPPAHEKPPTQPPSQAPAPKASPPVSQPPSQATAPKAPPPAPQPPSQVTAHETPPPAPQPPSHATAHVAPPPAPQPPLQISAREALPPAPQQPSQATAPVAPSPAPEQPVRGSQLQPSLASAPQVAAPQTDDLEKQQRIAREVYKYQCSRVQNVIHVPLVLMMMLYPTVLGFCLAIRLARFNLMMPTPHLNTTPAPAAELGSEKDLWRTDSARDIAFLFFTFVVVGVIHIYLASYLVLRSTSGGPHMSRKLSYVAPLVFWSATTAYLLYFVNLSRYGPGIIEWTAAVFASGFILLFTLYRLKVPLLTPVVVEDLVGPGGGDGGSGEEQN